MLYKKTFFLIAMIAWIIMDGCKAPSAIKKNINVADTTSSVLGTFKVGIFPIAMAYDGANIWVANYGSNNVIETAGK